MSRPEAPSAQEVAALVKRLYELDFKIDGLSVAAALERLQAELSNDKLWYTTQCAALNSSLIEERAAHDQTKAKFRLVASYAGVDMTRYTIEWLIEPNTEGMKPFEKLRALAYKERLPVGTLLYCETAALACRDS